MDLFIRASVFLIAGLGLLAANLWFVRSAVRVFFTSEYVIREFSVIDARGEMPEGAGRAMAQMTIAQLLQIQSNLSSAQNEAPATSTTNSPATTDYFGATSLFVTRTVEIPTDMFEPIDIDLKIGGVEVSGIFPYLQNAFTNERAIYFTVHEVRDSIILSADFGAFAPSYGPLWFVANSKDLGDLATQAAYSLLHARMSDMQPGPIQQLDIVEFRTLIEAITGIDGANRMARQGRVAEGELARNLSLLEDLHTKVPDWPEMIFLIANTAESLGVIGKARVNYRKLADLDAALRSGGNTHLFEIAKQRLAAYGRESTTEKIVTEERFIQASAEFARRMNLRGSDPAIHFTDENRSGALGWWDDEKQYYLVTPEGLDFAGMPQYIALMGRFFIQNFSRCMAPADGNNRTDTKFWNEFRYAVVDYLITSHPDFHDFKTVGQDYPLYNALANLSTEAGAKASQRLGLALLEGFDCAWNYQSLPAAAEDISSELQIADTGMVRAAIRSALGN